MSIYIYIYMVIDQDKMMHKGIIGALGRRP